MTGMSKLMATGAFSYLDLHFADLMARLAGDFSVEILLAAALVSRVTRRGHVCLDLSAVAGSSSAFEDGEILQPCPDLPDWLKKLRRCPIVGRPGEYKPLILDDKTRLYLFRYWNYQNRLANLIKDRLKGDDDFPDLELVRDSLDRLFPVFSKNGIDWQKIVAFAAARQRFNVISGGPGTGKTFTVAKILALLIELEAPRQVNVALTAPTGKAAARMQEAIQISKEGLNCSEKIKRAIGGEASTLHRLLGVVPGSPYFRHDERNPLSVDIVVVDEASMVDLALMSKLVQALPPKARIILLGDKDQLASVEAGAVLGDICDPEGIQRFSKRFIEEAEQATGYKIESKTNGYETAGIADCIVQLRKSYRFDEEVGIGELSRLVNEGDAAKALSILESHAFSNVEWRRLPPVEELAGQIKDLVLKGFGDFTRATDPSETFQLFERLRILCAVREGPYGVYALNAVVERILAVQGLIDCRHRWYEKRPIMVKTNDYNLRLFNGDVGIVLPDLERGGALRVFFPQGDGSFRKFHPLQVPEHETVYALTVHKSQGSEFDEVLLILPSRDSPVLTRELIYTGITRARRKVVIWSRGDIFMQAVSRRTKRMSGLRDALWEI